MNREPLDIDVRGVGAVLLADGWRTVRDESFEIGELRFLRLTSDRKTTETLHTEDAGFTFITDGEAILYGPLSSILAVRELLSG